MRRAQRGLFRFVISGCLLAPAAAWGQGQYLAPLSAGLEQPKVALSLTVESTMLIVQTLGQIQCQTVAQMATCFKASDLLKDIQNQVKAQQK